MSGIVERVAAAISDACAGCDPRDHDAFVEAARAAIVAMREPTQLMQDAGIVRLDALGGENDVRREHLDAVWRSVIDEALRDG